MSITSSSVQVEMNISVWTANKLDRAATDKVLIQNHADNGVAQVRKNLMAGSSQRKNIADFAAGCRLWHNTKTLPWMDRGARLLPTSLFMEYKSEANKRRQQFRDMVDQFLEDYPTLVTTASNYMGSLFDPEDYPSVGEVESKFGFRLVFSPVPEAGDFRLDVAANDLAEMQQSYERSFNDRINEAMKDTWQRLHKQLVSMSEKLSDNKDDSVKKRYHDTLITNAQELCGMLTHLNITNDPELEKARKQLELTLLGANIDTIKESSQARSEMKSKLDNILGQFEW